MTTTIYTNTTPTTDNHGCVWSRYDMRGYLDCTDCCGLDRLQRLRLALCDHCGETVSAGWHCLDGGEFYCDDCLESQDIEEGEREHDEGCCYGDKPEGFDCCKDGTCECICGDNVMAANGYVGFSID
jgi:hypothetical protein